MSKLLLRRRVGERIFVGDDVVITVEAMRGGQVVVAIEAPHEVRVLRAELLLVRRRSRLVVPKGGVA